MKLAVCQGPPTMRVGDAGWTELVQRVSDVGTDLLLLNEMPFGDWISVEQERDAGQLEKSRRLHAEGLARLSELNARFVLGSYPDSDGGLSANIGFIWEERSGLSPIHTKQFFPNEGGFYEARWFERGTRQFQIGNAGGVDVGFLICTDIMFNEWARYYGRQGAHLIAVPRATPVGSEFRWKTMCSAAAIVSGCYVASSNRAGLDDSGLEFAGRGWIVDPFGEVIVETSADQPVVAVELDLSLVRQTQGEYPCYVEELGG